MRRWFAVAFTSVLLCGWYPITFQVLEAMAADAPIQLPPVVVKESPIAPTAKPERLYKESEAREAIERTPGGVALIDSETITESLGTNFKDVLDFVPGVFVQPRQGGTTEESQFSIRGSGLRNNFHIRGINILQDGFILNNADGFFRPEVLEFSATKRVEVFKGANGLRFGSNTLGGAINLVTTTGRDSPPIDLWSEGGSFGFFKNYLATGNIFGPFDLYGGFTYTRADGYRDHSNTDRQRILSTVGYQFEGGTDLRLDLGYVRNKQALPGSLTLAEFKSDPRQAAPASVAQDERHDYHFNRAAFTVRTPLTSNQALEWFTHYNYTDLDHPLAFAVIDNVDNNWSTEVRYLINAPLFDYGNRFTLGMQYAGTRQIDYNFANNGGQRGAKNKNQINNATNVGVYFQNQFDATPSLVLVGGGRLDYSYRSVDDQLFEQRRFLGFRKLRLLHAETRLCLESDAYGAGFWKHKPRLRTAANSRVDSARPDQWRPERVKAAEVHGSSSWGPGAISGKDSLGIFPCMTSNCGTRSRTSMSSRFPTPLSLFRAFKTSSVRVIGAPKWASMSCWRKASFSRMMLCACSTAYTFSRFVFVNDSNFNSNDIPGAPRHYIQTALRYHHPSGVLVWAVDRVGSDELLREQSKHGQDSLPYDF